MPIEIHCSALPRILSCPQSRHAPTVRIEDESPEARIGSAAHEALAAEVRGDYVDIEPIAQRHGVEPDAIRPLYFTGRQIWRKYEQALTAVRVEEEASLVLDPDGAFKLIGTADVVAETDNGTLVVLDWKTGAEGDPWAQLLGYAAMHFQPGHQLCKCIAAWLREQIVEIRDYEPIEVNDFFAQVIEALNSDTYNPTPQNCRFCGRRHECPARTALVRASISDFLAEAKSRVPAPERLARLYPQVQLLKQALDQYQAVLKATLEEHGPLPLGDGRQLVLEEARRESLSPAAVLKELPVETVLPALSVSRPKLCRVIADGALRGQKKKAIDEFMSRLREQGGVSETTFHKIALRRIEEGRDGEGN